MLVRITLLLLLVSLSGCGIMRPGFHGSGVSSSEYRQVPPFSEVNLAGFGTVNVYPGDEPTVRVTTDDNLQAHVRTYVEDGTLKIKPRGMIRPKSGINVDVTVPQLTAARLSGAGDLNIHDVMSEQLDLSISGAGTLNANGNVNNLSASISGVGEANLRELYSENATVKISGAGDASVYASNSIKARVSGAGDVVCYGDPDFVNQTVSGVGGFKMKQTTDVTHSVTRTTQVPTPAKRTAQVPVQHSLGDMQR